MKYRIKLTQLITALLLLIAKPYCWTLFAAGMIIAAAGECIRIWASGNLYKDKTLATKGPYTMVRHPLYVGSFLMATGFSIACINPAYPGRTLALLLAVFVGFKFIYRLQVQAEDIHLTNLFANDYIAYKERVPAYIPDLSKFAQARETSVFTWAQAVKNMETSTILGFVCVGGLIAFKLYFSI